MVRVVWGAGRGPTAVASHDAALAAAGVHNHNLVRVSSVLPAGATVEAVGTAPDLGPVGGRLTVVEARATGRGAAAAALGWAVADAGGLFYEATETGEAGVDIADAVADRAREGLAAGRELREWSFDATETRTQTATAGPAAYATAVVAAVYGDADPV